MTAIEQQFYGDSLEVFMDEPPARVMMHIGQVVDEAVEEHERRCHAIPPPNRNPISAIPFPNVTLSDDQVAHAIEMLVDDREPEDLVAQRLDVPLLVLQRHLVEYRRRHGDFLLKRATTG